jgi:hypothetical protein
VAVAACVAVLVSLSVYLALRTAVDPYISLGFFDRNMHALNGVRVELYIFYFEPNGTTSAQHVHTFLQYGISLSTTRYAASQWLNQYGGLADPSLIGFAVHVVNQSGTIVAEAQSFTMGFDPKSLLSGRGFAQAVVFSQPVTHNASKALSSTSTAQSMDAATPNAESVTTTTVPHLCVSPSGIVLWNTFSTGWCIIRPRTPSEWCHSPRPMRRAYKAPASNNTLTAPYRCT